MKNKLSKNLILSIIVFVIAIGVIIGITACGEKNFNQKDEVMYESLKMDSVAIGTTNATSRMVKSASTSTNDYSSDIVSSNNANTEKKLIKRGTLSFEVENLNRTEVKITEWAASYGGCLENEIDSLPEDTCFRERMLHDMTLRLDGLYDVIVELEEKIEDVKLRRKAVEQDAITLDNI